MTYQTRSEINGLKYFDSFLEAMKEAKSDSSVWKVSFTTSDGARIRLVREGDTFVYKPLMEEVQKIVDEVFNKP